MCYTPLHWSASESEFAQAGALAIEPPPRGNVFCTPMGAGVVRRPAGGRLRCLRGLKCAVLLGGAAAYQRAPPFFFEPVVWAGSRALPLDCRYHAGSARSAAPWLRLCWSALYTHMDTLMRSTPYPAHHRCVLIAQQRLGYMHLQKPLWCVRKREDGVDAPVALRHGPLKKEHLPLAGTRPLPIVTTPRFEAPQSSALEQICREVMDAEGVHACSALLKHRCWARCVCARTCALPISPQGGRAEKTFCARPRL